MSLRALITTTLAATRAMTSRNSCSSKFAA
jgi:hypothetical protein